MKDKNIKDIVKLLTFLIIIILLVILYRKYSVVNLEFGLFAGSNWDVPLIECYKVYDEAIERFERQNPNIKISYRSGALKEDYSEWLAQRILNGKEPDVFIVLDEDFNTFSSIGMLKDLNPYIEKDKSFDLDTYYSKALEAGMYDNNRFALPMEIVPSLICVNLTLLKNEGIEFPDNDWTWEEFYYICKKVTKDTDGDNIIDQFGIFDYKWDQALYTNGQILFDEKGKTIQFEDSILEETIEHIKNINSLNRGARVRARDFDIGKVAFRPFTLAEYRAYRDYPYSIKKYSRFEWQYINFPKGSKGLNVSESKALLIGMSSRTKKDKAAWEFIKFLTNDEKTQESIWFYTSGMPANKKVASNIFETYKAEIPETLDYEFLYNIIESSVISPRFKKYNHIKESVDQIIYLGIIEEKNSNQLVRDIRKEINKKLLE